MEKRRLNLPLSLVSFDKLRKRVGFLDPLSERLLVLFPFLHIFLEESGIKEEHDIDSKRYVSVCLANLGINLVVVNLLLVSVASMIKAETYVDPVFLALLLGTGISLVGFIMQTGYPRVVARKKENLIEKNLMFALRDIHIQINTGVPLFEAMASVAMSDYGLVSEQFKKAVVAINAGESETLALDQLAQETSSKTFKRIVWQISNALKTGTNLSSVLVDIVRMLEEKQKTEIQEYGSRLNPLSLMYLLVSVILPSLGITMIIVVSSLPIGGGITISERTFWILLGVVVFFQFVFMNAIRSMRPNMVID